MFQQFDLRLRNRVTFQDVRRIFYGVQDVTTSKKKPSTARPAKQVPRKAAFTPEDIELFHRTIVDRSADLLRVVESMTSAQIKSVIVDGAGMATRTVDNLNGFLVNLESAIRAETIRKTGFRG